MEISTELVENLANLSKLRFEEAEKTAIQQDLERMVGFIAQLETVDTNGIEPLLHMGDAANVLREDIVEGSVSREDALSNAPIADAAFFKVPKVIKK
ncbi:MAG: Asp-tRNA(Asn)/Glu-tRNA(Gln) amidotransferase subunit GatC [Chitinophagaceae bacterium]|nr:Asp-tRNA(Asn)/Glu-tRNA(Gln) amidotransferase subunit GatC [Chitinophagaceae bacterium]